MKHLSFKYFIESINKNGYFVSIAHFVEQSPQPIEDDDIFSLGKSNTSFPQTGSYHSGDPGRTAPHYRGQDSTNVPLRKKYKEFGPFPNLGKAAEMFQHHLDTIIEDSSLAHISLAYYGGNIAQKQDLAWWNASSHSRIGFNDKMEEGKLLHHMIRLPTGNYNSTNPNSFAVTAHDTPTMVTRR